MQFFTEKYVFLHHVFRKQPAPCVDILEENIANNHGLIRVDLFMVVLRNLIPTGDVEKVKRCVYPVSFIYFSYNIFRK